VPNSFVESNSKSNFIEISIALQLQCILERKYIVYDSAIKFCVLTRQLH